MGENVHHTSYLSQKEHSFIEKWNFCDNLKLLKLFDTFFMTCALWMSTALSIWSRWWRQWCHHWPQLYSLSLQIMSRVVPTTSFLAECYNEASVANCEDNLATIFILKNYYWKLWYFDRKSSIWLKTQGQPWMRLVVLLALYTSRVCLNSRTPSYLSLLHQAVMAFTAKWFAQGQKWKFSTWNERFQIETSIKPSLYDYLLESCTLCYYD
jgi:hypothetical protein